MTPGDTTCGQCGSPITDEVPSGDPAQRRPCARCGSTARAFSLSGSVTVHVSVSAELTVVTYPAALLAASKSLISDGQPSIAVVVAHMACEVAVERALSAAFAAKRLQQLEEPVTDFMNGYNLANDRNRRLYTALTGDAIEREPFWSAFVESASRRNKIMHEGRTASRAEAEASHQAAVSVVTHLKQ